jgi:hypothetical protein
MLMEATDRSLEKMRSITSWWDLWDERQKALLVEKGWQVSEKDFPKECEAMSTIINVMDQHSSFKYNNSIICEGHHFARYYLEMRKTSAWKEFCREELIHGNELLSSKRVESHMKGDTQDRSEVAAKKQDELLNYRGS